MEIAKPWWYTLSEFLPEDNMATEKLPVCCDWSMPLCDWYCVCAAERGSQYNQSG